MTITSNFRRQIADELRALMPQLPEKLPEGFYVYQVNVGGCARYVGKGRGARAWAHFDVARALVLDPSTEGPQQLYRLLAGAALEARKENKKARISVQILGSKLSEQQAFVLEKEKIEQLGRLALGGGGRLTNLADGGAGVGGKYTTVKSYHQNGRSYEKEVLKEQHNRYRPSRLERHIRKAAFGPYGRAT